MAMTKRQLLTKVDAGLQFIFWLFRLLCLPLGGYSNIKRDKARAKHIEIHKHYTLHNLKDDQIN